MIAHKDFDIMKEGTVFSVYGKVGDIVNICKMSDNDVYVYEPKTMTKGITESKSKFCQLYTLMSDSFPKKPALLSI